MKSIRRFALPLAVGVGLVTVLSALPFLDMLPTFTQEVWAVSPGFMGGMAFAPDGDLWVTPCTFGGGALRRFDQQSTVVVNGTTIHPRLADVPSNVGCGLTNHPNGSLYSNTSGGCARASATSGAPQGSFGPPGNALGIAVHPLTLELVYVGSNGTLYAVQPDFSASRTFSTALTGLFVDGIFFAPRGDYLFTATRTSPPRVSVLDGNTGALIRHNTIPSEPDGIAFHAVNKFVLTVNTNGTMTALKFPGDDFSLAPQIIAFASGGFRGDIPHVGPDGYLYLPQSGTRYDNGQVTSDNSVVRLGPGFSPPPGVSPIQLSPLQVTRPVATDLTLEAHVGLLGANEPGREVHFEILNGPNQGRTATDFTDAAGIARFTYTSFEAGGDLVQASFVNDEGRELVSNVSVPSWEGGACLVLDFSSEDDRTTPLVDGQHLDTEFGRLVTITSSGANAGAAVFDSSTGGPNDPSQDPDLLVDTGMVLILQTENYPPDAQDVFPVPNDDRDGGTFTFAFQGAVELRSVRLIDIDADTGLGSLRLVDDGGRSRVYLVPANWTGDRTAGTPGQRTLDLRTMNPQPGFGSVVTASQTSGFDDQHVVRLEVTLAGSGALDDLAWCPSGSTQEAALVTVRNGSGANPSSLSCAAWPTLGGNWVAALDCGGHAPGLGALFVNSLPGSGPVATYGEWLVSGVRLATFLRPHGGGRVQYSVALPLDITLVGRVGYAQGLCLGAPAMQLSNALDVTLGF